MKLSLPVVLSLCIGTSACAQQGIDKVVLNEKNNDISVKSIEVVEGGNEVCIVGDYYDTDGPKSYARIIMLDTSSNKILWQKKIKAPENNHGSRFVSCRVKGDAVYALANVDSSHAESLNFGLVYVYKFDRQGKQLAYKPVALPGGDAWAYTMDTSEDEPKLLGLIRERDEKNEYYSIFLSKFDSNLNFAKPVLYKTGGYSRSSAVKLINKDAYLAGNFTSHKMPIDDVPADYANSRIRLGGNYVWSVRPQHTIPGYIASTISDAGTIYSVGFKAYNNSASYFTSVDQGGKVGNDIEYKSEFCDTSSLAGEDNMFYMIRKACDASNKKSALVSFNVNEIKETKIKNFSGEPMFVFAKKEKIYLVSKEKNGNIVLQHSSAKELK